MSEIKVSSKVIKLHVSTGWANGDYKEEIELPEEWDSLSEDEKEAFLNDVAVDYLHECCEVSAWVEDKGE